MASADSPDLVHVFLQQTSDGINRHLTVSTSEQPRQLARLGPKTDYRRLTKDPVTRAEATDLCRNKKKRWKLGQVYPVTYYATAEGFSYTVRQIDVSPKPVPEPPIQKKHRVARPATPVPQPKPPKPKRTRDATYRHKTERRNTEETKAKMQASQQARRERERVARLS